MIDESDLELIDAYLDGDAAPAQNAEVRARLSRDPEFAGALAEQRSQRAVRLALWQEVQPDEATANHLANRIVSTVHRRHIMHAFRHVIRIAGAIAACIVLGFVAGWVGRGRAVEIVVAPAAPAEVVVNTGPVTTSATTMFSPQGVFVAMTNENGEVTAIQYFSRPEDAGQFAKDIKGIQTRREQIQQGKIVLGEEKTQFEF